MSRLVNRGAAWGSWAFGEGLPGVWNLDLLPDPPRPEGEVDARGVFRPADHRAPLRPRHPPGLYRHFSILKRVML